VHSYFCARGPEKVEYAEAISMSKFTSSDKQTIADKWMKLHPLVNHDDDVKTLEHKLQFVNALGLATITTKYNKNIDIASKFTLAGARVLCDIVSVPTDGTMDMLLDNLSKSKIHPKVAAVMLRYKNLVKLGNTYYLVKIPIVTKCSKMKVVNETALIYTRENCTSPLCGCSIVKSLIISGLYTYTVRYGITDMQLDIDAIVPTVSPSMMIPTITVSSPSVTAILQEQEQKHVLELALANDKLQDLRSQLDKKVTTTQVNVIIGGPSSTAASRTTYSTASRSGTRWSDQEDDQLTREYRNGASVRNISQVHQRSVEAISARLEKLGLK